MRFVIQEGVSQPIGLMLVNVRVRGRLGLVKTDGFTDFRTVLISTSSHE